MEKKLNIKIAWFKIKYSLKIVIITWSIQACQGSVQSVDFPLHSAFLRDEELCYIPKKFHDVQRLRYILFEVWSLLSEDMCRQKNV